MYKLSYINSLSNKYYKLKVSFIGNKRYMLECDIEEYTCRVIKLTLNHILTLYDLLI